MKLKIFFVLFFVNFSTSQVVFPDSGTTRAPTFGPTSPNTMPPTTQASTKKTEPTTQAATEEPTEMEEPTEEEETTEPTEGESTIPSQFQTTQQIMTTIGPSTPSPPVTICAAIGQCEMIDGGRIEFDGSGKMDVRVNNVSEINFHGQKKFKIYFREENEQIQRLELLSKSQHLKIQELQRVSELKLKIFALFNFLVIQSQSECPLSQFTEPCILDKGYKCGIGFQPIKGLPQMEGAAPYGAYPWEGLVMRNDIEDLYTYYCTGALITHRHFITVANKVMRFV